MVAIVSLLFILGTSLVITRVASVALEHTGLSRDSARFQALSAFSGVGFTTTEAEHIVDHPTRRRIAMWLMLIGNVGIVSAMAAVLISAIDLRAGQNVGALLTALLAGLALLWVLGTSAWVDRQMCRAIRWAIEHFSKLDAQDYARLLHLRDDYGVSRLTVEETSWLAGKMLSASRPADEGILVLGIECPGGNYIGAPPGDVEIGVGDELVVYGPTAGISELCRRVAGESGTRAHAEAALSRTNRATVERQQAQR